MSVTWDDAFVQGQMSLPAPMGSSGLIFALDSTADVPWYFRFTGLGDEIPEALAIARARQVTKEGRAAGRLG